jgi:ectoine hydroxylase-related dioxygenase (phytanoyl-CoA dioxygenase family)
MELSTPSAVDDYFFDLNGYLILRNALSASEVASLNDAIDGFPDLEPRQWLGNAQRRDYTGETGFELHNCVEAGAPFAALIDHPSWINYARRYCGEADSYVEGLFIDECIVSRRSSGGHHPVHSGGYQAPLRTSYHYSNGSFRCGMMNMICALSDIGPDDGPTMVIPGSHKSNFTHPLAGDYAKGDRMDTLPGAIPVLLNAGDAVIFVDSIMHGGASRANPEGERRVLIYRYGVSWGRTRFGYTYSEELLDRLTPTQRKILQPRVPELP